MRRVLAWTSLLVVGGALVGLGVRFALVRLDDADKWGSVVAALVAVLGMPITVYGLVLSRRSGKRTVEDPATFTGGAQARATNHGIAIGQVGGDVHFGQEQTSGRRIGDTGAASRPEAGQ
ncbi:hypothetical protein [Micromonospora chokoriensis]|uniref:hypothetical protein n=1 Tax=Micromonospora chokoriensis TaxID=356851 RepID=UPI0004C3AB48|nr:hypothetical protein [Micromonospora chokoriensis]